MTITLQEGKTYVTRDGVKVGPVFRRERATDYPWRSSGETHEDAFSGWTDEGRYLHWEDDDRDLVEEWVEPCPAQIAVEGLLSPAETLQKLADVENTSYKDDPLYRAMLADDIIREPAPDIKAEIADTAKRIVSGARRAAYGKPEDNFERIARFWDAYFKNRGIALVDKNGDVCSIEATDVSPMMRLMKEARLCETPDHKDSFVDLVGYALTGAEVNGVKVDA